MTKLTTSMGSAFPGPSSAPGNPWGRCGNDPHSFTSIANNGFYQADHSHAASYGAAANFFGVSISGQTGYSQSIYIDETNHTGQTLYICGTGYLPNAPVLYDNNGNGQ